MTPYVIICDNFPTQHGRQRLPSKVSNAAKLSYTPIVPTETIPFPPSLPAGGAPLIWVSYAAQWHL